MSSSVDLRGLAIDRGDTGPPQGHRRRQVLTRYVLPLTLLAGFLGLVVWASWESILPPRAVTVIPVLSSTAEARPEGTALFQAAGWIEPRPTPVRVAALAPGVVESLLVVEDQSVSKGDSIAQLVEDDARLAHERAVADLNLRQAELKQAEAALTAAMTRFRHPVHLHADLGEAEAELAKVETQLRNLPFETRQAEAEYEAARKEYEGKLAAESVVAGVEIDIAKGKRDAAEARVDGLRDRRESLERERVALIQRRDALQTQLQLLADEIKARDEAIAQREGGQARVAQAQVAVAEAKLRLERMTIRAPIDGRIFRLIAHPGAQVGQGGMHMTEQDSSTVVTMYDPQRLQVRVDVRFEDIPKVTLGQTVEIGNPALESPITGRVLFVSSEADIQKNTLEVKVEISEAPAVFKPEMLVDVTFLAPRQPESADSSSSDIHLYVPRQLVRSDEQGDFIWVADRSEGRARRTRVELGTTLSNGLVEVNGGLTPASRLIAGGIEGLEDGDRITIGREATTVQERDPQTLPESLEQE